LQIFEEPEWRSLAIEKATKAVLDAESEDTADWLKQTAVWSNAWLSHVRLDDAKVHRLTIDENAIGRDRQSPAGHEATFNASGQIVANRGGIRLQVCSLAPAPVAVRYPRSPISFLAGHVASTAQCRTTPASDSGWDPLGVTPKIEIHSCE
jgi:hypothetical protein